VVNAAVFNYSVAWSPTTATITAGASTAPSVVATLTSGAATSVSCTVTVPAVTGLAASPLTFSLTPTTAGASQVVTITTTTLTPASGAAGYTISVSCSAPSHSANFILVVNAAGFDYSLRWSPTTATITAAPNTAQSVIATLTARAAASESYTVTVLAVTALPASRLTS